MESSSRTGRRVRCANLSKPFWAFVPEALPPKQPVTVDTGLSQLLQRADQALNRLDQISMNSDSLSQLFIRKDVVYASALETGSFSLEKTLMSEAGETSGRSSQETVHSLNAIDSLRHGTLSLREGKPLDLRLMREMQEVLTRRVRARSHPAGEFRRSQHWVGGRRVDSAKFVPPPIEELPRCLNNLDEYMAIGSDSVPPLVKAAMIHAQFQAIHPFIDGQMTLSHFLNSLVLCGEGILEEPILYLSQYFHMNQEEYKKCLYTQWTAGGWEEWVRFFVTGICEAGEHAAHSGQKILDLFKTDAGRVESLSRPCPSAKSLHGYLQRWVMASVPRAAKALGLSQPTVKSSMDHLVRLGIVREMTGKQRNRVYVYEDLRRLL